MKNKKVLSAFLCLMFFAVLCISIMLITNIAFNKDSSSDFFSRYQTFEFGQSIEEGLNG